MTATVPTVDEFAKLAARVSTLEALVYPSAPPQLVAPPQAAAAGYSALSFADDFDYSDMNWLGLHAEPNKKWYAGLWYEGASDKSHVSVGASQVTIMQGNITTVMATDPVPKTGFGRAFDRGYYEALIYCTNWSAFWMMAVRHMQRLPTNPSDPMTWTAELDIMESDSHLSNGYYGTLHKSTSGDAGVADEQNGNNSINTGPTNVNNTWNKFGALVTDKEISWWFNDHKVSSAPLYPSTLQPMALILGVEPGGILSGPVVQPVIMKCDWVRAWTKP